MDRFLIHGGTPLHGTVRVSGSKNAALPMMAASLVAGGPLQLQHAPDLADVRTLAALLRTLGVESHRDGNTLTLECVDDRPCRADYDLVRRMRASICVLGPLLAKRGRAIVSLPGGCNIGHRPIDLHLKGLRALGAEIQIENGYVIASASRLKGAKIHLGGDQGSTVTGTCNVMTAACLASGTTVIDAAACEPEVVDLGRLLIAMGAKIEGLGTSQLVIDGVDELAGASHTVIPDRIEAATLMIAAAITGGDIAIENVALDQMVAVVDTLREMGVSIVTGPVGCIRSSVVSRRICPLSSTIDATFETDSTVGERAGVRGPEREVWPPPPHPFPRNESTCEVDADRGGEGAEYPPMVNAPGPDSCRVSVPHPLRPIECRALPHPGFPTDVQAQLTALLCLIPGQSSVTDQVFPSRFMHVSELLRMGADIRREGDSAVITGVAHLSGAHVMASDLRASAALVLAALAARGETTIHRIYHLDRGYEQLEIKLQSLGARVERIAGGDD